MIHCMSWHGPLAPWTLPSNTLTVGKKIDYVVVETFNQYTHLPIRVLLAKALYGSNSFQENTMSLTAEALRSYEPGAKKILLHST